MSDAARRKLEALSKIPNCEYQSDFAEKHFSEGQAEGQAKGKAEALL